MYLFTLVYRSSTLVLWFSEGSLPWTGRWSCSSLKRRTGSVYVTPRGHGPFDASATWGYLSRCSSSGSFARSPWSFAPSSSCRWSPNLPASAPPAARFSPSLLHLRPTSSQPAPWTRERTRERKNIQRDGVRGDRGVPVYWPSREISS